MNDHDHRIPKKKSSENPFPNLFATWPAQPSVAVMSDP